MQIFENRYKAVAYLKSKTTSDKTNFCYMLMDGNAPFYVGICKQPRRLYEHESDQRCGNKHKLNKIAKIKASGRSVRYCIVGEFHSWIEACHAERSLILLYKKAMHGGILTNILDGGEGAPGRPASEKQRKAASEANKGKPKTKETLDKLSNSLKEYYKDHDSTFKGKKHTDEAKALISKQMSGENHPQYGKGGPDHWARSRVFSQEVLDKIRETKSKMDLSCTEERKEGLRDYWSKAPLMICPHCGKESRFKAAMIRHHFDKCKAATVAKEE